MENYHDERETRMLWRDALGVAGAERLVYCGK
jgi:hypothetical protein